MAFPSLWISQVYSSHVYDILCTVLYVNFSLFQTSPFSVPYLPVLPFLSLFHPLPLLPSLSPSCRMSTTALLYSKQSGVWCTVWWVASSLLSQQHTSIHRRVSHQNTHRGEAGGLTCVCNWWVHELVLL